MSGALAVNYWWRSVLVFALATVSALAAEAGFLRHPTFSPSVLAWLTVTYNWVYPLAALLCIMAAIRSPDRVGRRTWQLLGASSFVLTLSAAVYWIPQALGFDPWTLTSDLLSGVRQLLVAAAVVGLVPFFDRRDGRVKIALDVSIALGAAALITLQFLVELPPSAPIEFTSTASGVYLATTVATSSVALLALTYLTVRLRAFPRGWPIRLALISLVVSMSMNFLTALAPGRWAWIAAPTSLASSWLLAFGAFLQIRRPMPLLAANRADGEHSFTLVPYAPLLMVELVLVLRALSVEGNAARVLLLGSGLLLALLVMRQIVALRENSALMKARSDEQERFALLLKNSSDAAILVTADGIIRSDVPALARLLGEPPRSFEGESILDLVDAEDRPRLQQYLGQLVPGETSAPVSVRVARSPIGSRFIEIVAADHRRHDVLNGVILNVRDVSERVGLEAQLREAHKMEGIGRLAGGIAHDFNNLLTAILGNCELIETEPDGSAAIKDEVSEVRRAAERASDLVRQLLQFARRELVAPRVLTLEIVLAQTERLLKRLLAEDIELGITCRGGPLRIKADATQLDQVILNLVVNARDSMPNGGRLTISAGPRYLAEVGSRAVGELPPGPYVELRVSDTGFGMPPEVLSRIFEPFYTTKSVGEGTGLGLATTYGIVRQLGGSIVAESRLGEGSVFTLLFPMTDEPPDVSEVPVFVSGARRQGTVLLAEDEPAVRSLAARALRERGFDVIAAVNGEDGVRAAREHNGRIDYVVSDLVMPKLGGLGLVEALRELGHAPRVLFITGYSDASIPPASGGRAEVEVLLKPFAPSALIERIDRLRWDDRGA